jgi:hypothetical protein
MNLRPLGYENREASFNPGWDHMSRVGRLRQESQFVSTVEVTHLTPILLPP